MIDGDPALVLRLVVADGGERWLIKRELRQGLTMREICDVLAQAITELQIMHNEAHTLHDMRN
jgi:hypothetical protein